MSLLLEYRNTNNTYFIKFPFIVFVRPFNDDSVDKIFENIKKGHIEYPEVGYGEDQMSPQAKDLIEKLLNPDYKERLGAKGASEIKNHPFFKGFILELNFKRDLLYFQKALIGIK